jgi:hypothetical protein
VFFSSSKTTNKFHSSTYFLTHLVSPPKANVDGWMDGKDMDDWEFQKSKGRIDCNIKGNGKMEGSIQALLFERRDEVLDLYYTVVVVVVAVVVLDTPNPCIPPRWLRAYARNS